MALVAMVLLVLGLTLALGACDVPDPFVASHSTGSSLSVSTIGATTATVNGHPGWKTYTDPILGFIVSYPPSWILLGAGGGHSTLASQDGATLSPIVTTVSQSPAQALAQNIPSPAMQAEQHQTIANIQVGGQPAVDIFSPYIPSTFQAHNSGRAQAASEGIVMAVQNDAGTTNVYLFLSYYQVDKQGNMSAAALADVQTVKQIVATFQLPVKIDPADQ
jgi:hypothetical protein